MDMADVILEQMPARSFRQFVQIPWRPVKNEETWGRPPYEGAVVDLGGEVTVVCVRRLVKCPYTDESVTVYGILRFIEPSGYTYADDRLHMLNETDMYLAMMAAGRQYGYDLGAKKHIPAEAA